MKRPRIPEVQVWQVFDARIRIRNSEFQSPSPFFICVLSVLLLELIKLRPRRVGRWTRGGMELGAPSLLALLSSFEYYHIEPIVEVQSQWPRGPRK